MPVASSMSEQRIQTRARLDRAIVIKLSSGETIHARMVNLSLSGLAICYPAPGEVGAELGLYFQLPDKDKPVTIHVKGIVRHSHIYHEDFITGIEFIQLKEEDSKHISNFLSTKASPKQPAGFVVHHRHRS